MNRKNKRKINSRKFAKFILFFSVCLYIGFTLITQQIEIIETKRKISVIEKNIAIEKQKQEELAKQKELVNTPEYIEKLAREKLDFVAPDEIVFVDATQIK